MNSEDTFPQLNAKDSVINDQITEASENIQKAQNERSEFC